MVGKNLIIVAMDGGICSQIAFYAYGYALEQRGFEVKYDMSFYHNFAKDNDGRFTRNFDLLKAFPKLRLKEATQEEIDYYKKTFLVHETAWDKVTAPAYVSGYPDRTPALLKYRQMFIDNFNPADIKNCHEVLEKIKQKDTCAVHVRRGDLSSFDPAYGYPCSAEYFINAVKMMRVLVGNVKFFFFSDEPDWVKENIVSRLTNDITYCICDQNGSDKGYLDLYLMTKASHLIASKGSLAKYAKCLQSTTSRGGYMISPNDCKMLRIFDNCIFYQERAEAEEVVMQPQQSHKTNKVLRFFINFIPGKQNRKTLRKKYCNKK